MTTEIERISKYKVPAYRMAGWVFLCALTGIWPGAFLFGIVEGALYIVRR